MLKPETPKRPHEQVEYPQGEDSAFVPFKRSLGDPHSGTLSVCKPQEAREIVNVRLQLVDGSIGAPRTKTTVAIVDVVEMGERLKEEYWKIADAEKVALPHRHKQRGLVESAWMHLVDILKLPQWEEVAGLGRDKAVLYTQKGEEGFRCRVVEPEDLEARESKEDDTPEQKEETKAFMDARAEILLRERTITDVIMKTSHNHDISGPHSYGGTMAHLSLAVEKVIQMNEFVTRCDEGDKFIATIVLTSE
jgi:hypothetical protein